MRAKHRNIIQSIPARIPGLRDSTTGRPRGQQTQSVPKLFRWDWTGLDERQLRVEFPAALSAGRFFGRIGRVHGHAPFGCAHNDLRLAASRLSGRSG